LVGDSNELKSNEQAMTTLLARLHLQSEQGATTETYKGERDERNSEGKAEGKQGGSTLS
jgi:hypothetical protein